MCPNSTDMRKEDCRRKERNAALACDEGKRIPKPPKETGRVALSHDEIDSWVPTFSETASCGVASRTSMASLIMEEGQVHRTNKLGKRQT